MPVESGIAFTSPIDLFVGVDKNLWVESRLFQNCSSRMLSGWIDLLENLSKIGEPVLGHRDSPPLKIELGFDVLDNSVDWF